VRFAKGHGTQNDFVVLPDAAEDDLDVALIRALCDRRTGIGADGVLRVGREQDGTYFMDYRNADGSIAETCGNGIRVFARYLVDEGLARPGEFVVGTRTGPCRVTVPADGGDITVEMGTPVKLADADITIGSRTWPASGWSMGNPHLVVLDAGDIDALDLTGLPGVTPADAYPNGVNVELLAPVGAHHVRMRVHERGVGETKSCGSGACAAAVAAMDAAGERASYLVDVPGGRLMVEWRADDVVTLSGPAVIIARGVIHTARGEYQSSGRALTVTMTEG
jgi:diaminopimelate epimerase